MCLSCVCLCLCLLCVCVRIGVLSPFAFRPAAAVVVADNAGRTDFISCLEVEHMKYLF